MTEERTPYEIKFIHPIKGIVVIENCDCCGQHTFAIKTETGEYVKLEPGMKVTINGKYT